MKMPTDKEWYEKRAAAEGDHEIGAGRIAPPPAYNHCTCSCHRGSGKMHIVACCSPSPETKVDTTILRERISRAIFDPGQTEGVRDPKKTLTDWQTDAVMRVIGFTPPSPQMPGSFGTEDSRLAYQRDHAPQEQMTGEPWGAYTVDYLGCEHCGSIDRVKEIAAAGSMGPTEVVYLYAGQPPQEHALVKPLEWAETSDGVYEKSGRAKTPIGSYEAWYFRRHTDPPKDCYGWQGPRSKDIEAESYEAAKAAAQADYERTILAALTPSPQTREVG